MTTRNKKGGGSELLKFNSICKFTAERLGIHGIK